MKIATIRVSAAASSALMPLVDRLARPGTAAPAPPRLRSPARPSSAPPGAGTGAAGRASSAPCARARPRRGSAARGRAASAACPRAARLVGLVLGLLGDVGALRLGIALGDGSTSRSLARRRRGTRRLALTAAPPPRAPRGRAAGRARPRSRTRRSRRTAGSARAAPRACRGRRSGPPSMTTISSASEIVESRWATTNVVRPSITSRSPRLISASVRRVDRRGRVVEDQDPRVGEQRPGDRDRWRCPPESVSPRSPTTRLVAVRQPLDEPVRLGAPRRLLDLAPGSRRGGRRRCSRPPSPRTGSCRRRRRRSRGAARGRRPSARRRRRPAPRPRSGRTGARSAPPGSSSPTRSGPTRATVRPGLDLEAHIGRAPARRRRSAG